MAPRPAYPAEKDAMALVVSFVGLDDTLTGPSPLEPMMSARRSSSQTSPPGDPDHPSGANWSPAWRTLEMTEMSKIGKRKAAVCWCRLVAS